MSAAEGRRGRGVAAVAVVAAVLLVLGSGAAGFALAGGLTAGGVPGPSSASSAAPVASETPPTVPTSEPTPAAETVSVPASCDEAYPTSLLDRSVPGFVEADEVNDVDSRVGDADVRARFGELDGIRCRWDDGYGRAEILSAAVAVPSGETPELIELLRATGSCATVRSGVMCVMPRVVREDGSEQLETHMVRDGVWAVHIGEEDTPEYAAAMSDVLYGEVDVRVPST